MVKFFTNYGNRVTKIAMRSETLCLCCEAGYFTLYNSDGSLCARSFRSLTKGLPNRSFDLSTIRPEDKFTLIKISDKVVGVKELLTGTLQDYLVLNTTDLDAFNEATFLYISLILMDRGYDNKASNGHLTKYDLTRRVIIIDNVVTVRIYNCSAIFNWSGMKEVVKDISKFLSGLGIESFCELKV